MLPCRICAYRDEIPGDEHSRCRFDWVGQRRLDPSLVAPHNTSKNLQHTARWFMFPFNYDPLWGPDSCAAHTTARDEKKIAPSHPLLDILSLLR